VHAAFVHHLAGQRLNRKKANEAENGLFVSASNARKALGLAVTDNDWGHAITRMPPKEVDGRQ